MAEIVDIARGALNAQPFSAQPFSALLGTKLMQVDSSSLTLCLTIRDKLRQQHGFVHGGVVSYLVDNALTFAGALRLGPKVVMGEYKINYLRPAVSGTLMARARVVYAGMTQATCQCDVYVTDGGAERLVAVAQGTIHRISEMAAELEPVFNE